MDWEQFWTTVQNWLTTTGIRVAVAIVLLIVSFTLINWFSRKILKRGKKLAEKKHVDKTVYKTLSYVAKIGLKVLVVVALIAYLGIDTSGITALVASLGGMLLLITRPFKDDDYIAACGYEGTVEDILICNTKLRTPDNKVVYLPNGKLSTSEIVNYSEKDLRRVDLTFCISYDNDFEKAKSIINEVAAKEPLILSDPAGTVRLSKHGDSSLEICSKFWCKTADYWDVYFNLTEAVKKAFDENGIEIPFNQLDVHVKNN